MASSRDHFNGPAVQNDALPLETIEAGGTIGVRLSQDEGLQTPTDRFMATVVSLLPEGFLKRDPRDAVADLLDDLSPSLNAERVR